MSKPNLQEILKRDKERITELEKAIPVYQDKLKDVRDVSYQNQLRGKLDEMLLEYKERIGHEYH